MVGFVRLSPEVTQRLAAKGIRLTKQREEVLGILLQKRDHPTAAEVFLRAKRHMASISLATVYNCLEALVQSGLVKQVNLDRAPTRYCANLLEHSHFFCERCGSVFDVDIPPDGKVITVSDLHLPPVRTDVSGRSCEMLARHLAAESGAASVGPGGRPPQAPPLTVVLAGDVIELLGSPGSTARCWRLGTSSQSLNR